MDTTAITCTVVFLFLTFVSSTEHELVKDIVVKQGGKLLSSEITWPGNEKAKPVTCKFTYQAQEGKDEKWIMGINYELAPHMMSCIVERLPITSPASGVLFEKFKLELKGGFLKQGEVYGDNPYDQLPLHEFEEDFSKHTVSHAGDKFKNKMTKIVAYFTQTRFQDEL